MEAIRNTDRQHWFSAHRYAATVLSLNKFFGIFFTVVVAFATHADVPSTDEFKVGDSIIRYHGANELIVVSPAEIHEWVSRSAHTVAQYYKGFPAPEIDIYFDIYKGGGVSTGRAYGSPERKISVTLGNETTRNQLDRDWVLVHEMIHLAFASMYSRHHWIEEGLSVYVESIARTKTGELKPELIWHEFAKGMLHGLPKDGDRGLDNTPTWGRTYWGGALFCLLADIEIRKQTQQHYGLRDALIAIVKAGATNQKTMSIIDVFSIGDDAIGVPVLQNLYAEMKDKPIEHDLPALWRSLGIVDTDNSTSFNNSAPLASIREDITKPYES